MIKGYESYLFDIDGTLLDTTELIYLCFDHVCQKFGKFSPSFQQIAGLVGLPLTTMFQICFKNRVPVDIDVVTQAYKAHQKVLYTSHLKLFPKVDDVLKTLKNQHKKIAAVTARKKESLVPYLEHTGILVYFDVLVTPEMTDQHKPHPLPALTALSLLKTPPERAIMIGDARYDIECGAAAGLDTGFVTWSHNSVDDIGITPTFILNNITDLIV